MQHGHYGKERTESHEDGPKLHFKNRASDTVQQTASAGVTRHQQRIGTKFEASAAVFSPLATRSTTTLDAAPPAACATCEAPAKNDPATAPAAPIPTAVAIRSPRHGRGSVASAATLSGAVAVGAGVAGRQGAGAALGSVSGVAGPHPALHVAGPAQQAGRGVAQVLVDRGSGNDLDGNAEVVGDA